MARSRETKMWLGGGVGIGVVSVLASWMLAISPQLDSAESLQSQTADAAVQNTDLAAKLARLEQQKDQSGRLAADLRSVVAALPSDSGLPALTKQVTAQAKKQHVVLKSITVGGIGSTTTGTSAPAASGRAVRIPITLISDGTAQEQMAFLHAIQVDGPRRALVSAVQLSGTASRIERGSTMTIQLTVFSASMTAAAQTELVELLGSK